MMQEREDSTARHIRCFSDLHLAATNIYAGIDVYDLFRRTVNLVSSLQYTFLYLFVLRNAIVGDKCMNHVYAKWRRLNREDFCSTVPFRTTVDILTNVSEIPRFSHINNEIIFCMLSEFTDREVKEESLVLLSRSMDTSFDMQPVEPAQTHPVDFKLKKRPHHIEWNHKGEYDLHKLHKRLGSKLTDQDIDILTDDFIWPNIQFNPSLTTLDKLSLIATGYTYAGKMDVETPKRFWVTRKLDFCQSMSIPNNLCVDIDFKTAQSRLTDLSRRMNANLEILQKQKL